MQIVTIILFIGSFLLTSCKKKAEIRKQQNTKDIARVGSQYLALDEAKRAIPANLYMQDSTFALKQYRQQWIQQKLVMQQAERLNLEKNSKVQKRIEHARYEVLRETLRKHVMAEQVDSVVTDHEVRKFYEQNKEQFVLKETFVQFRHLKTESIEDARIAKIELDDGDSWELIAANYADQPNRAIHQSSRAHALSTVLNEAKIMKQYLQNLGEEQISPIKRIDGTYHFVQLLERRKDGEYAKIDWVNEKIKEWILTDRRKRKFNSYLKNLYLNAQSDNEIDTFNVISN